MGRHGRKDIGGRWKDPKILFLNNKDTKKDIMDAKNISVLLGENWISYCRINGSKNDFMDNLYYHGLPMCSN